MSKPTYVFDLEIFKNYFLAAFLDVSSGKTHHFEMTDQRPLDLTALRALLQASRLISFNGTHFDLPLLTLALQGASCLAIKRAADRIIVNGLRHWDLGIEPMAVDHIDVMDVAPGQASLKLYGARMHAPKLQDLPLEPDASIDPAQHAMLRQYCENDLKTTLQLYETLSEQIALREQLGAHYGIDLRSKSDAQMAEAVIRLEVERASGKSIGKLNPERFAGKSFYFKAPAFISFHGSTLNDLLVQLHTTPFHIGAKGALVLPKELADCVVSLGNASYRLGIGGLHSSERSTSWLSDDDHQLIDRDVTSYYPSIILRCGLSPQALGSYFLPVYQSLVERRIAAKRAGDKVQADSLKITINGSFGKFGSPYSCLYAPALMIQTTLTGQLALLMLIESLQAEGIDVVSANTDGLVMYCAKQKLALADFTVWQWEQTTGFQTEATHYKALYSRDVNNYIALTESGYKAKGVFAASTLQKNPQADIVMQAVIQYLRQGTPIQTTIECCNDIRQFIAARTVKGGAEKDGIALGRVARWYYAKKTDGVIQYQLNKYTVPKTQGAKPIMDLPDKFPDDVDRSWYIEEAHSLLDQLGVGRPC